MKKLAALLFILLPVIALGQLFPNIPDYKGNIKKITEKRYGKEMAKAKNDSGVYKPGSYSGLKYTYLFNRNSVLTSRVGTFKGKTQSRCTYQTEKTSNKILKREKLKEYFQGGQETTVEYENFTDQKGRIQKVNVWVREKSGKEKELVSFETDAQYDQDKLTGFTSYSIKLNGDTASGEKCNLQYDQNGRLIKIERKDISSGFTNSIHYTYNDKGCVDRYSIDLLTEVQEYGKKQVQEIYFKYDRQGNWTRMYANSGDRPKLQAKRAIRYY